jgi:hypothetical protein
MSCRCGEIGRRTRLKIIHKSPKTPANTGVFLFLHRFSSPSAQHCTKKLTKKFDGVWHLCECISIRETYTLPNVKQTIEIHRMTTLVINEIENKKDHKWLEATVGKVTGSVFISPFAVTVCTHNASHKAWKGQGRRFTSLFQARGAYKSKAMRSIIDEAISNFAVEA